MNNELKQKLYKLKQEEGEFAHFDRFEGFALPSYFAEHRSKIENFEVRDDDVWVAGFPKSGMTMTQEMVWLIVNNLDYEGAKTNLDERYTLLEFRGIANPVLWERHDFPDPFVVVNKIPGKRFIVTYLPWNLLPLQIRNGTKKPKIVYIMRNVKDLCISSFHNHNLFMEEEPTLLDAFIKLFITDNYIFTPYWNNILSYWNNRQASNLLILKYEDVVQDLAFEIRKVAAFFETTVPDSEMEKVMHYLVSAQMQQNGIVNREYLMESIKQGDLNLSSALKSANKEELSEDMIQLLDAWTELNVANTDFRYDF